MQIVWLKAFMEVKRHMNFSEAAEAMFVSQSTLSKYIHSLENELSIVLFERTTRTLRVTEAGEELAAHIENVLDEYNVILDLVKRYRAFSKGEVRLICVPVLHLYGMTNIIMEYENSHPNVSLTINEVLETEDAIEAISSYEADVAIIRANQIRKSGDYFNFPLIDDELVVLCSQSHPMSKRTSVSINEIMKEKVYVFKSAFNDYFQLLRKYGVELEDIRSMTTCMTGASLAHFLTEGKGISLQVRSMVGKLQNEMENMCVISIEEHPTYPLKVLVQKSSMKGLCAQFINYLLKAFAGINDYK